MLHLEATPKPDAGTEAELAIVLASLSVAILTFLEKRDLFDLPASKQMDLKYAERDLGLWIRTGLALPNEILSYLHLNRTALFPYP